MPAESEIDDVFMNNKDAAKDAEQQSCTKSYKTSGRLGAGVVLFWCVKHRECIGFTVLQKAESCQIIYEILSTRFKKIPNILIYDNACNLFEVRSISNYSTAIIEILSCFPIQHFLAMGYTTRIIQTVRARSTASSIPRCVVSHLLSTSKKMEYWESLRKLPHLCVGMCSIQSFSMR